MKPTTTRKEAKAKGLKRFFPNRVCAHGHLCEHYVTQGCVICNREKNLARYHREPSVRKKIIKNAAHWAKENRKKANAAKKKCRIKWLKTEHGRMLRRAQKRRNKARRLNRDPIYRAQKNRYMRDYYQFGASNPTGGLQWVRKNQAQLRALRRLLQNPKAYLSPSEALKLGLTLQI